MRQLIFLLFFLPIIVFGQQSPTQILNTPWQKINYKLEVGQRLLLPADTLSYPPGATVRDTTRLLAFAPNGNLYKLWNGVWSLIGAGGGTDVQLLSDTAIVVGDDTVRIKPITFESDMPSAYFFKDGDTIRDYTLQYLNDSVKVRKSGDTLFFPNGDTVLLEDASTTQRGFVNTSAQGFAGEKNFIDKLTLGQQFSTTKKGELELLTSTSGGLASYSFRIKDRGQTTANQQGLLFDVFRDQSSNRGIAYITGNQEDSRPIFKISGAGVRVNQNRKNIISELRPDSTEITNEGLGGIQIGGGSTAARPASVGAGSIRYNSDSSGIEWYNGSAWRVLGSGGGGSGTVTTGYGINGDGSGGDPLRVDTATLRGDYIRNQYAAKEAKNSWYQKARLDSLLSGFVTVQHNNANGGVVVLRDKGAGVPPSLGDNIGQFAAGGYVGDTVNLGRRGGMRILANQNWSNTANGSTVLFDVTTNNSLTARVRARLWGQGFGVSGYGTSLGSTALTPPATLFVEKSGGSTNNTKAFALHDSTGTERFHVTDSGRIQGDAYAGSSQAQVLAGTDGTLTRGYINTDDVVKAFRALGSGIKAQTVGMNLTNATIASTMQDSRNYLTAVYLSEATTITGVGFLMATQGDYTADNNNRVGLYSYSGGTLTLVASSANNGNLWKAAANTVVKEPFTTPYVAQPGIYFVGLLYNSSAQTTAPQIRRVTNSPSTVDFDFTNSAKISGSVAPTNNDLGASIATTDVSVNTNMLYVFIY